MFETVLLTGVSPPGVTACWLLLSATEPLLVAAPGGGAAAKLLLTPIPPPCCGLLAAAASKLAALLGPWVGAMPVVVVGPAGAETVYRLGASVAVRLVAAVVCSAAPIIPMRDGPGLPRLL
jgi:hypothetical protein